MSDKPSQVSLSHYRCGLALLFVCLISGCNTLGYYYQSVKGQVDLMGRARDIEIVLADNEVAPSARAKLKTVLSIRRFASESLQLPDNDSYTSYADLEREYALWNVFAAPGLSTRPHQWCFPIAGCVVYRGYFGETEARRYAGGLQRQGLETFVMGVPAYSTLGWFDDPVLNTVLNYSEADLAGLIFHELAHQVAYVKNDSVFNESFATTVEIEGVERWLQHQGKQNEITAYQLRRQRDSRVVETILAHRRRLDKAYRSDRDQRWKLQRKAEIISSLKERYTKMVGAWEGYQGYSHWFEQELNNAHFVPIVAYHDKVPAFRALLARHGGDLPSFYGAVIELGRQPASRRDQTLRNAMCNFSKSPCNAGEVSHVSGNQFDIHLT